MPVNYIKKLRDKYDLSTAKLEKKWDEATLDVGDEYNDKPEIKYAAITKIFKKKINKSFDLNESETLDTDDYIDITKKILLEQKNPIKEIKDKEDLKKAINEFDDLYIITKAIAARHILKMAEKLNYKVSKPEILKFKK